MKKYNFVNGFARVKDNVTNKWGFIDTNLNMITECKYDYIHHFDEKLNIATVIIDNKCGLIDKNGNEITKCIFDIIRDHQGELYQIGFHDNLARLAINYYDGVIDNNGNIIIPFKYNKVLFYQKYIISTYDFDKYYIFDRNGKLINTNTFKISYLQIPIKTYEDNELRKQKILNIIE